MSDAGRDASVEVSLQDVIYAGLDAVQAVVSVDLCAYLHAPRGVDAQLYLGVPSLSALPATRAMELFRALGQERTQLHRTGTASRRTTLAGFHAVSVFTSGTDSDGVHVVGRLGRPLDDAEEAVATRLCLALGKAGHVIDASAVSLVLRRTT